MPSFTKAEYVVVRCFILLSTILTLLKVVGGNIYEMVHAWLK
jgi:hypothetical protein